MGRLNKKNDQLMQPTLYLAPIQGITDRIFRSIFPKYFQGFDLAIAPFIFTSKRKKVKGTIARKFGSEKKSGIKTIPQILGNDPEDFLSVAQGLNEIGYDTINWNLGCPYPIVARKGRGAGMLIFPEKIDSFLDKIMPRVKFGISIKLRLGMFCTDEILKLIPVLNRYPLKEIIIHPRTGQQMYNGSVDLLAFERCLDILKHPIVYNGDIDTLAVFEHMTARFKTINRWMIGRGVLKNPFLIEEIKFKRVYTKALKLGILSAFHKELFWEYSRIYSGPDNLTDKMKSIWNYLADFFDDSKILEGKIKRTNNVEEYLEVVDLLFN